VTRPVLVVVASGYNVLYLTTLSGCSFSRDSPQKPSSTLSGPSASFQTTSSFQTITGILPLARARSLSPLLPLPRSSSFSHFQFGISLLTGDSARRLLGLQETDTTGSFDWEQRPSTFDEVSSCLLWTFSFSVGYRRTRIRRRSPAMESRRLDRRRCAPSCPRDTPASQRTSWRTDGRMRASLLSEAASKGDCSRVE
jgi:hypothetical protein